MNMKFQAPPKTGDKVILVSGTQPELILTVNKVTPTGIVRTKEGVTYKPDDLGIYRQSPRCGYIGSERIGYTEIAPHSPELEKQVNEYQKKKKEETEKRIAVNAAKSACHEMGNWNKPMSYETAQRILEIYKAWESETEVSA